MKKIIVVLLLVGLMSVAISGVALADGTNSDTQIITGNTESTLNLVAACDFDWLGVGGGDSPLLQVPDANGSENFRTFSTVYGGAGEPVANGDETTSVRSNVVYDIKVKSDIDLTKTSANMWQFASGAYVSGGKFLQMPLRISGNDTPTMTAVTGSNVLIHECGALPVTPIDNSWTASNLKIDQRTDYGDVRLVAGNGGGVYRAVLTYTASATP